MRPSRTCRAGVLGLFLSLFSGWAAPALANGTEGPLVGPPRLLGPGEPGSNPREFTPVGERLFFAATTGGDRELWSTDGTPEGTRRVSDILPGPESSSPQQLAALNGVLLFSARTRGLASDGKIHVLGQELWRSDGTAEGTCLVKDINPGRPGTSESIPTYEYSDSYPSGFKVVGDVVYFRAKGGDYWNPSEGLWRSDGTPEGTRRVTDISPGPGHSVISCVTSLHGVLYFSAAHETTGTELWRSDGTPEGTRLVKDINPGPEDSGMNCPLVLDGALYFTALQKSTGMELWRSEGTEETTRILKELVPGTGWGVPWQRLFPLESGGFLFSATAPDTGTELWMSDGTAEGTRLVADVSPGAASSNPGDFVRVGNILYFTTGSTLGRQLWAVPLAGSTPPNQEGTSGPVARNPCRQSPDAGGEPDAGGDSGGLGAGGNAPPEFHPLPLRGGCGAMPSDALPLAGLLVMAVLARRSRGHKPG